MLRTRPQTAMIAVRIYRLLMVFYPAEFQREYGPEMAAQFAEEWAEARGRGLLSAGIFWLRLVPDWAVSATRMHGEITERDLRSAAGSLKRHPLSNATLIGLFSAVVAANTVALLLVYHLIWEPLPYEAGGRMVFLAQKRTGGNLAWQGVQLSLAEQLRRQSRALTDFAYQSQFQTTLDDAPLSGLLVNGMALRNLGVTVEYGRLLEDGDEGTAVLSPQLWERRYRKRPAAIGSTLHIMGRDYRIVGVLGAQPDFPFAADVWLSRARGGFGGVFARLRPGASIGDAQREWLQVEKQAGALWPAEFTWLRQANREPTTDFAIGLLQAAFLVALLLACADMASFQFAHVLRRQREVAIRMAVGASRARLLRFLLTEGLVMAGLAGLLSMPIAAEALGLLRKQMDWWGLHRMAGWSSLHFGAWGGVLAMGVALASGILGSMLPAWRLVNRDPWGMLAPMRHREIAGRLRLTLLSAQAGLAILVLFLAVSFSVEGRLRLNSPVARHFRSAWKVSLQAPPSRPDTVAGLRNMEQILGARGYAPVISSSPPFVDEPGPVEYESGGKHLAYFAVVNSRFFEIPGFRFRDGRAWTEEEARSCANIPVVVNSDLLRDAPGARAGQPMVLLNANGYRARATIAGILQEPSLDLYKQHTGSAIFVPFQCGNAGRNNLLVRFGGDAAAARSDIEAGPPGTYSFRITVPASGRTGWGGARFPRCCGPRVCWRWRWHSPASWLI
ncbi:membrane hypothetical protein [Candidatus Sulfopaludibacter sp. SbA3]|nr:membrane hypothetical protein [Candidatus Sulfopaludibacter sp. SbA3]